MVVIVTFTVQDNIVREKMPPSIGLTHLRVKSQPKHTFEERLHALTLQDEQERSELAAQWRNTHRPGLRATASPEQRPETAGSVQLSARLEDPDLTVQSATAERQVRSRVAPLPKSNAGGKPTATLHRPFLSPPSTVVRDRGSYMEDPHAARLNSNAYVMYFRSSVHDADVARQLLASAPSQRRGTHNNVQLSDGHSPAGRTVLSAASDIGVRTFNLPSGGSSGMPMFAGIVSGGGNNPLSERDVFDELRSAILVNPSAVSSPTVPVVHANAFGSPTKPRGITFPSGAAAFGTPAGSDAAFVASMPDSSMSIPTIVLNQKLPQPLGVEEPQSTNGHSPTWYDDDLLDDDDMGFSPNHEGGVARRRAKKIGASASNNLSSMSTSTGAGSLSFRTRTQQQTLNSSSGGYSFNPTLPVFGSRGGTAPNASALYFQTDHDPFPRVAPPPGAPPTEQQSAPAHRRWRRGPPPIDVTELKPKCAALHVKLEKISQRMKAEDDEFDNFLHGYLKKLRST
jgi:hypothetical protein